uniref:Uncharacterized protein n=1 Tax=Timspurckia oligopyrenoides TaxID=708627 RepID=A0A7S0ZDD1_9RHOD|mmetsp:Transcript_13465/g.24148  ORF Transcript_13465/g.24148 Transcript_13465/m.24148 type:complete len:180 (+) Transcript_13465:118-657(+)
MATVASEKRARVEVAVSGSKSSKTPDFSFLWKFTLFAVLACSLQLLPDALLPPNDAILIIRSVLKGFLALFFTLGGSLHFRNEFRPFFLKMIPPFIPFKLFIHYATGVYTLICGPALMFKVSERYAAMAMIVFLFLVSPAHVYVIVSEKARTETGFSYANAWIRIVLQVLLVIWCAWYL